MRTARYRFPDGTESITAAPPRTARAKAFHQAFCHLNDTSRTLAVRYARQDECERYRRLRDRA